MTRRIALALALLSAPAPSRALAEERDVKGAEAAYAEAEKLLERGQSAQACVRYADSYRLDPQLGALLHIADCNERIDRLATAWRAFDEGHRLALQKRDERAVVARERADALLPRLTFLRVNLPADADDHATIVIDGAPLVPGLIGTDLPVDRGTHSIVVTSEGQEKWRTEAVVKGVPGVQYFDVPSWHVQPSGVDGRDSGGDWLGMDPSLRRTLGWTSVGLGVAGLGLSTYFFARQSSMANDAEALEQAYDACTERCDDTGTNAQLAELADDQKSARTGGIIAGVAGAVFLAGGAVLLFAAPAQARTAAAERAAAPRAPQLGLGFGTVTLRGEF